MAERYAPVESTSVPNDEISGAARREQLVGALLVVASAMAFGLIPWWLIVAKRHGATPMGVLTARFVIASAVLLVMRRVRYPDSTWPRGRVLAGLIGLGSIAFFLQASLYLVSVTIIPSSLATVLFYTAPVLVVIFGFVFFGQRPNRLTIGCLVIAVVGTALTAGQIERGSITGALMAFGAAVVFAWYTLISARLLPRTNTLTALTVVIVATAFSYIVAWAVHPQHLPNDRTGWLAVIAIALVSTVFSMGAFFAGLRRVGPAEASILSTAEPIVTIFVGVLVLGEHLSGLQLVGALLVLTAVTVLARDTG